MPVVMTMIGLALGTGTMKIMAILLMVLTKTMATLLMVMAKAITDHPSLLAISPDHRPQLKGMLLLPL